MRTTDKEEKCDSASPRNWGVHRSVYIGKKEPLTFSLVSIAVMFLVGLVLFFKLPNLEGIEFLTRHFEFVFLGLLITSAFCILRIRKFWIGLISAFFLGNLFCDIFLLLFVLVINEQSWIGVEAPPDIALWLLIFIMLTGIEIARMIFITYPLSILGLYIYGTVTRGDSILNEENT